MEYRICRGNTYEVETKVNDLLSAGFEIVGGLVPSSFGEVAQAMIKWSLEFDPTGKYERDLSGKWVPRGQLSEDL